MIRSLSDYEFLKCIHNDGIISLHSVRSRINDTMLLLKTPVNESDPKTAFSYLKNEYFFCSNIKSEKILPAVRFVDLNASCIVEYKYYDIIPLALTPDFSIGSQTDFLNTAISLAELLVVIHDKGIIHCNLSPFSIFKNISSGLFYISGFYIASTSNLSINNPSPSLFYRPNCRYISPEQTGNIDNRSADERTDLYALGVIFYEMLCGEPPFTDHDYSSLLYSHVAREPIPLNIKNKYIYQPLAQIIGKLLEKNPADRYQSAQGLIADLEECASALSKGVPVKHFCPGSKDRIIRLLPIKKLYGREEALKEINDALLCANKSRTSAVFISGQPGVGKTSLADAFFRSVNNRDLLFAHGKCDLTSKTIPYHALNNAIVDLLHNIISQGNESVAKWRNIFLESISYNREIIAEFIPQIQMIIGPCPKRKIPADAFAGTQFKNVFIRFLRLLIRKDSTLVFFIDDMQWADHALYSIVLQAFFEETDSRFLFIGAGRSGFNENNRFISEICKTDALVKQINLSGISLEHTKRFISDVLGARDENINELGDIVFEKTGGNPFFLKEFLEMLVTRRLLIHTLKISTTKDPKQSAREMVWQWDREKILQLSCTENVVDIILDKAKMLPSDTLNLLKIGACVGMSFSSRLLSIISEKTTSYVEQLLTKAIEFGILQYMPSIDNSKESRAFRFNHDRMREAFYSSIDREELERLHLKIGRDLIKLRKPGASDPSVFDIVKHFNPFHNSIKEETERRQLALLNREAADRARNANACQIATEYLKAAITFLPDDAWETAQEIRFDLELSLSECDYMNGFIDESLFRLTRLSDYAINQRQQTSVDLIRMLIYYHRKETAIAIKIGFDRLKAMGINLPQKPSLICLVYYILRAAFAMRKIVVYDKKDSGANSSVPEPIRSSFRILARMWLFAFTLENQSMVASIVVHLILKTRLYGRTGASSVAICFWGILIGKLTGNPVRGMRYGTLALSMAQQFDDLFSRGITYFLYGSFFAHLEGHIDTSLSLLSEGRRFSYEAGDINSASNSTEGYVLIFALSGKKLKEVRQCATESLHFLKLIGIVEEGTNVVRFIRSWAEKMETSLDVDEAGIIAKSEKELPLVKGIYLLLSMIISTVAGDYRKTLLLAEKVKGNPLLDPISYFYYLFIFMNGLAAGSLYSEQPSRKYKRILEKSLRTLKRSTRISPVNLKHLLLLITAENHRINKRRWEALHCYRQSIESAREHNFLHLAAIAAERASLFMKPYNIEESRSFLRLAMSLYNEWGSEVKVSKLKREAPDIQFNALNGFPLSPATPEIDLQALLKSFEAITNELNLDRLLEKLICIIMENSGAQRGILLLEEKGCFTARVEGILKMSQADGKAEIETRAVSIPLEQFPVPQGIISYVYRSAEPVRLENAAVKDRFVHDPYIKNNNTRSVLCLPLVNKERIRGIIYLENNILEGAFPPHRLLLMKILCGQAIISIENALFHEIEIKHLQSKVNPHFLYNAFSSIAELCHTDPDATEDALIKLSALYRYVLKADINFVTLEEELEIVTKYLSIEKLRFGDRLSYDLKIKGDTSKVRMPSMLIQPLVENSIKHGITPRTSGGKIVITVLIADERCSIKVEDDGMGRNKSSTGTGYGLDSIRKRLELHYHNKAFFEINDVAGFKVHLSIPLRPN